MLVSIKQSAKATSSVGDLKNVKQVGFVKTQNRVGSIIVIIILLLLQGHD